MNAAKRGTRPPRLAGAVVRRLVPPPQREAVLGDLAEGFAIRLGRSGRSAAIVWYWRQAIRSLAPSIALRWVGSPHSPDAVSSTVGLVERLGDIGRDVVLAARTLGRNAGYTSVAVATLSLGMGAYTAIFAIANAVWLRPLPFAEPDRLFTLWEQNEAAGRPRSWVSPPMTRDLATGTRSFSDVSAYTSHSYVLTGSGDARHLSANLVSPNFFRALGVTPELGTLFAAAAPASGNEGTVVISHAFWTRHFGADSDVVGASLELDGQRRIVVGVLQASFWFPSTSDVWAPLNLSDDDLSEGMRDARYLNVLGRIRPGVTQLEMQADLDALARSLGEAHPNNRGWSLTASSIHEEVVRETRPALRLLLGAVAALLLIACANATNLVVARAVDTGRLRAVRMALGASRWRLHRQHFLENLLLAGGAGVMAGLLASLAIAPLVRLAPATVPRLADVGVNGGAWGVIALSAVTIAALLTAVAATAPTHMTVLSGRTSMGLAVPRLRRALIVLEVSLSLVLTAGSALLLRSFAELQSVDPGFRTDGVESTWLSLPASRYSGADARWSALSQILNHLSARPEIVVAALTTNLPISGSSMQFAFSGGTAEAESSQPRAEFHAVTEGYFRALGIPVRVGRGFTAIDGTGSPPVVIVNERLAALYWPGTDPLGERIAVVSQNGQVDREIVGVVGDTRHEGLSTEPAPELYIPLAQEPWRFAHVVTRTREGEPSAGPLVTAAIHAADPLLVAGAMIPLDRHLTEWFAPLRFQLVLIATFGAAALLLACIGLYGVISYFVAGRTNEIGIRMALGAEPPRVFGEVLREGLSLVAVGLALGLVLATGLARLMGGLLYGVHAADPPSYAATIAVLGAAATAACWLPARRATRIDPIVALRNGE